MAGPAKNTFLILLFKYKDYILNSNPVKHHKHMTSFTSRQIFNFVGNQLSVGHLYCIATLHSLGYSEKGTVPKS